MKFTQTLSTHLTPEWRKQYINYEDLKSMLMDIVDNAPVADSHMLKAYYARFDEKFFERCEEELTKVNTFFAEKESEAQRKHAALKVELNNSIDAAIRRSHNPPFNMTSLTKRKTSEFKFSFSEIYLSLVLLQNYQSLNHTGFRKILKKHDKVLGSQSGLTWFENKVNVAPFYTNRNLMKLIHDIEYIYTHYLEGGDRTRAMKRLRVPPLAEIQHPWTTFRVGLFAGAFLVLIVVIYFSFKNMNVSAVDIVAATRLFRGPLLIIIFLFLIGVNICDWRKFGVNHILIFEIDPRDHLTASHLFEMAAACGVLWALSILGFLYCTEVGIAPYVFPLGLLVSMMMFLLNPFPVFHYSSRLWLLRLLGRVAAAPFCSVEFADFWMADQLNSLVVCFGDYKYLICFYLTNWNWYYAIDPTKCIEQDFIMGPLVSCLPAWFRFAQSMRRYYYTRAVYPYLVNAGKYSTTFFVVTFATLTAFHRGSYEHTFSNPYLWGYIVSHAVSSIYCLWWDFLRDFGIFTNCSGENIFLREQILYPAYFYYFAIVENFSIRFFWILSLSFVQLNVATAFNMTTIGSVLEVFRRYIWNYFRLENEHLFNVGKFRAVRDISIVPIDPNEAIVIQHMMDEEKGVKNRRAN